MPVTAGELNRNNQETQHEADNTEKNVAPESRPEKCAIFPPYWEAVIRFSIFSFIKIGLTGLASMRNPPSCSILIV